MVPPYGTAIQEAIASGDVERMKATARAAEEYLREHGNVPAALEALRVQIARHEAKK